MNGTFSVLDTACTWPVEAGLSGEDDNQKQIDKQQKISNYEQSILGWSKDAGDLGLNHLAELLARLEAVIVGVVVDVGGDERLGQDGPVVVDRLHRPQERRLLRLRLLVKDPGWNKAFSFESIMSVKVVTVYIDDASIDDWSSMLASSFLSKSTIEIDDPSQYGLFWQVELDLTLRDEFNISKKSNNFEGRVEHFQKVKQLCHPSVIIMNSITIIIEALLLLLGALNSGGVVPPNNHCNIRNFLRTHECEELAPAFIAEEIEVRQIAQLSNEDLLSLGVRTIGARLRLRSAAASWEPQQVCLFL